MSTQDEKSSKEEPLKDGEDCGSTEKVNKNEKETSKTKGKDEKKSLEQKMFTYCTEGNTSEVQSLINKFPHLIGIKDDDNYSPLHRAAYSDHVEIVKMLIENGADIEARTIDGWTPLHCACKWSHLETASILIDSGANINARSLGNVTPLHLAAATKNRKLIELLLYNQDIDASIVNNAGDTALDIARRSSPLYKLFDQINY